MTYQVIEGDPRTQGVIWDGAGVNVALYSEHATAVELCLFDGAVGEDVETRVPLPFRDHSVWHARILGIAPGQRYGFRVHGPHDPLHGQRFNAHKLLIDPYARALHGSVDYTEPIFGYIPGSPRLDLSFDQRDSAQGVPRGVVIDPRFDWGDDQRPDTPWSDTIIYEIHVKGFTARHPDIPPGIRGTYAGMAHPAAIEHLTSLGITAVELLPIHDFVDEPHLVQHGLINYWGYNTIAPFAPSARYAACGTPGGQVNEFKRMVRALHQAGIEVLLDVVFNHTGEGNQLGPTISLRGIDNSTYYRLAEGNARQYVDVTGTGNSLHAGHPQTLKLIMDSLRYWITEMHVDGFRFDLATTLGREQRDFSSSAAFFKIANQDPIVSRVKLIAEPWDIGEGGYQAGNFPPPWAEWNAAFRDDLRRYWRGDEGFAPDLAVRLTGSSDEFEEDRGPLASINFVTAHDGFTLHDLVSFETKHNEANSERNVDGSNGNFSRNYGVEGPTDDEHITALRERQKRNLLTSLFISQGVPMLLGGDEFGRTQRGNNNAYPQDNEISWLHWQLDPRQRELLAFVKRLIAFRRDHPTLRRAKFFQGKKLNGSAIKDITWLRPDGHEMSEHDWHADWARSLGALIDGHGFAEFDATGERVRDASLLVLTNSSDGPIEYVLPSFGSARWGVEIDSSIAAEPDYVAQWRSGDRVTLGGYSMMVLQSTNDPEV